MKSKTTSRGRILFHVLFVLLIISVALVGGITTRKQSAYGLNDYTYAGTTISMIRVEEKGEHFQIKTDENGDEVPIFTFNIDSDRWQDEFLNNSGKAFFNAVVEITGEFKAVDGTENISQRFPTSVFLSKPATFKTAYVILKNATLKGIDYKGNSVSGVSLANLNTAGFYQFTSMTFEYHVPNKLTTLESGGNVYKLLNMPDNIVGEVNANASVDDYRLLKYRYLYTSNIVLDANQMQGYVDNNLGINSSLLEYGATPDFRDIVKLHSTTQPSANKEFFTFSTKLTSYNVSNQDIRFFNRFGKGVGIIDEQVSNVESGANDRITNLAGLNQYLTIDFYTRTEQSVPGGTTEFNYTMIPRNKPVKDAETYYLRINLYNTFEYELEPIQVVLSNNTSELYEQKLEIRTKALFVDIEGTSMFSYSMSKTFDQNSDAKSLFKNSNISENVWTNQMAGVLSDYTVLQSILKGQSSGDSGKLFDFAGSRFNSPAIEKNKTVYMKIAFIALPADSVEAKTLKNYHVLVVRGGGTGSGGSYSVVSPSESNEYDLGNKFEIRSTEIHVNFNTQGTGDSVFQPVITYGDWVRFTDRSLGAYINATGTQLDGSTLRPFLQPGWKIVFVKETDPRPSDTVSHTIYIVTKVGKPIDADGDGIPDGNFSLAYTDADGKQYYDYEGSYRMFAGLYYIYYDVYIVYQNDANAVRLTGKLGNFMVTTKDGRDVVKMIFPSVQELVIEKKNITVTVTELLNSKYYDGTDKILKFAAIGDGIFKDDIGTLEFYASAKFSFVGAGNEVPIVYEYKIRGKNGNMSDDIRLLIDCYNIDVENLKNNSGQQLEYGRIERRDVIIRFIETNYSRQYNTLMYVAVRVGKQGDIDETGGTYSDPATGRLKEDLYYYYLRNEEKDERREGFVLASSLASLFSGNAYVKLELVDEYSDADRANGKGYVAGEYFSYHYDNEQYSILRNKATDNPNDYSTVSLDTFGLLSWLDSALNVKINRLTDSSADKDSYYRLEGVDEYQLPNYALKPIVGNYGNLFIEKLDVDAADIKISEENQNNYLEYSGLENLSKMFSLGRIDIGSHHENAQIPTPYGNMLTVIGFLCACNNATHNHGLDAAGLKEMRYAGTYTLELSIPATTNYNVYTIELTVVVNTKRIAVYVTLAMRTYGDSELVFEDYEYIDDIANHRVKVDGEGNIVRDDEEGNLVYMYQKDPTSGNKILYHGLIGGESMGDQRDKMAKVSIVIPGVAAGKDKAGTFKNAVQISGAEKYNYEFEYNNETLFVLKKPLTITADAVQEKYYTGETLSPDYIISGGKGVLAMYIIGQDGVMDSVEDETKTNVVDCGEYILKIYAKPDMLSGEDSNNYAISKERLQIKLTVKKTNLTLNPNVESASVRYSGKAYELDNFPFYFSGEGKNGMRIPAMPEWGTVEIVSVEGLSGTSVIDFGTYRLSVLATVTNTKNVHIKTDFGNVHTFQFEIELTVNKYDLYNFSLIAGDGVGFDSSTNAFSLQYNGKISDFSYSLFVLGEDYSDGTKIGVVGTVNGFLYSFNGKIYRKGDPAYGVDAALALPNQIPGVQYDITNRPDMKDVGAYELKYYINHATMSNYNPNFMFAFKEYSMTISKAPLRVFIGFEEGYSAKKVYKESNESVEKHVVYRYEGWMLQEGNNPDIVGHIVSPVIDWGDIDETTVAGVDYSIRSIDGVAPSNYVLDHSFSEINFVVERATSWAIVYGFFNDATDTYETYSIYSGREQKPLVQRMSGSEPIYAKEEDVGSDGIKITFKGRFTGKDKDNIGENDFVPGSACVDVGEYVFAVSVASSMNYQAVPEKYYYMEIRKADLKMYFVELDESGDVLKKQGSASKIYDASFRYPTFNIIYEGFVGADGEINAYKNIFSMRHIGRQGESGNQVDGLGLTHPFYKMVDASGKDIQPINAGSYTVKVVFGKDFGVAKNYNISVVFAESETGEIAYPIMIIQKRPIDIMGKDYVEKIYDATTKADGLIKRNNYEFIPIYKDGTAVAESGLIINDTVNLTYGAKTCFERKDVFDTDGNESVIKIRVYGYRIDNPNYNLQIADLLIDSNGYYFLLNGFIRRATADIRFTDTEGQTIITRYEVVYNAERHEVLAVVNGVLLSNGTFESVDYSIRYDCEESRYHDTMPPKDAQNYIVTLSIRSKNYVATEKSIDLVIQRADVSITFGGDIVQTFGEIVSGGLNATAHGIGYEKVLTVAYFDESSNPITNIALANAGTYTVKAVHEQSTNFKFAEGYEKFYIKKLDIRVVYDGTSSYGYTGKSVAPNIYFEYKNVRYTPELIFNKVENGVAVPFNYGTGTNTGYPVSAGLYQLRTKNEELNFNISNQYWSNFRILKGGAVLGVNDIVMSENSNYELSLFATGTVNGEGVSQILTTQPQFRYYHAGSGEELALRPVEPGVYRVVPYGAESINYELAYTFGLLTINKISIEVPNSNNAFSKGGSIFVEGSFGASIDLIARGVDKTQYSQYNTAFSLFQLDNVDYAGYSISGIYYLKLSDGSLTSGGEITVKIYAKEYFDTNSGEDNFKIARIMSDGSVEILNAEKDGNYLVFRTSGLEAFAILTTGAEVAKERNFDWMLYVGIAAGIAMIAVALIIVKKRA